jgi:hypothetical protein
MWRLLRGIQLLPEKIEVLPADSAREYHTSSTSATNSTSRNHSVSALLSSIVPTSLAGLLLGGNGAVPAGTYQLRIVVRIVFELWSWKQ